MKNKNPSAYQKMFLVTPSVYQKLLTSIEEKDKISIEELNTKKDFKENKTISEKLLEKISGKDIGLQAEPNMLTPETEAIPQTQPILTREVVNEPPTEIFDEFYEPNVEILNENIQDVYKNPLNEPCPQDTDQGSIIPNLFYKPSIKNKVGKKTTQIDPLADQSNLRKLRSGKVTTDPYGFPCHMCNKKYTRKHDLKRHLESKTAHTNLTKTINQDHSNLNIENLDNEEKETFDYWDGGVNLDDTNAGENLLPKITPRKRGRPTKNKKSIAKVVQGNDQEFQTWNI